MIVIYTKVTVNNNEQALDKSSDLPRRNQTSAENHPFVDHTYKKEISGFGNDTRPLYTNQSHAVLSGVHFSLAGAYPVQRSVPPQPKGKTLSEWLKDDPEFLKECRTYYKTKPEWFNVDSDKTPVFYRPAEEVKKIRAKPRESGGHHPFGLAMGGPEGQTLTTTNETLHIKNPEHIEATKFQRKIINKIKPKK